MEIKEMGRVTAEATVENAGDLWNAQLGELSDNEVRRIVVPDALVDTGATLLSLPTSLIRQLGLAFVAKKRVRSSTGPTETSMYSAVRLTIMGRSCTLDVTEVPDGIPTLIGQIPLEYLDFVVDPQSRSLIGNPAHGGELIYEMY